MHYYGLMIWDSFVWIRSLSYILHPIKRKHPNKPLHLSQRIHQLLELFLSAMILIPIHEAHRIERKVDMGNSSILVDGVGDLMALA